MPNICFLIAELKAKHWGKVEVRSESVLTKVKKGLENLKGSGWLADATKSLKYLFRRDLV